MPNNTWFILLVLILILILILILAFLRKTRSENMTAESASSDPTKFHCGATRWPDYISHLQTQTPPTTWTRIANMVLNDPPEQSQRILTHVCHQLNANNLTFDEIDKSFGTELAPPPPTPTSRPTLTWTNTSIYDYILTSNVKGCDMSKMEQYFQSNPDQKIQLESIYTNWVNFATDRTQQKAWEQKLNEKLQKICQESNPDGRTTSAASSGYNSYQGWLFHQPEELLSNNNLSQSCTHLLLGPIMDNSPQKDKIYAFLDEVLSSSSIDDLASILSWMCSIARLNPSEFEPAMTQLIQQGPNDYDLDAITKKSLSPAVQNVNAYKILEVDPRINPDMPKPKTPEEMPKPKTPEEITQILKQPTNFDAWVNVNPKSQGLFTFDLQCQNTVGNYMNASTISGELYSLLNDDSVTSSDQVSFFKKLCYQDKDAKTVDSQLQKIEDFWNTTSVDKAQLNEYLSTHDKVAFFEKVYNERLSKSDVTQTQTDDYVKNNILNIPPIIPAPPTIALEWRIPAPDMTAVEFRPVDPNTNTKKYICKGYLQRPSPELFLNAVFVYQPPMFVNIKDANMSGMNDMQIQTQFTEFIRYRYDNVPDNVQQSSHKNLYPYYVWLVTDKNNVVKSIIAMGITDYSRLMSTDPKLIDKPREPKLVDEEYYQSMWVLEEVNEVLSNTAK
jgi:hypothetical protein